MKQIIVYLSEDYVKNDEFLMNDNVTKKEVTSEINKRYSVWYYYDIWDEYSNNMEPKK